MMEAYPIMVTIARTEDLLPLLGEVVKAEDPVAALEKLGHTFSTSLRASLLQRRRQPTAAQNKLWKRNAAKAGTIRFTAGQPRTIAARPLEPGEYEFVAGVRLSSVNEILAGLYASGTIVDLLFLDQLLAAGDRAALQTQFVVDRPGGQIGRFFITSAPTAVALDGDDEHVQLTVPFRLNFEGAAQIFGGARPVVTFATGQLRLIVALAMKTDPPVAQERNLEIQLDLSAPARARLDIDASSPVRRLNPPAPGTIDGLAIALQNKIQNLLASSTRISVSAAIPLPVGSLDIREAVVRTRGDALVAGIKVIEGTGNPDTLVATFPSAESNLFTRVHEEVLRAIIHNAATSGQLTRLAKRSDRDAVISSADVSFREGKIEFQIGGKIVDACTGGVDVDFTATVTLALSFDGDKIRIRRMTDIDLDNTDIVLCIFTSLGVALFGGIAVGVLAGFWAAFPTFGTLAALTLLLEYDGDDLESALSGVEDAEETTMIDLDFPIPGTDLLPTLSGASVQIEESTLLLAASLATVPDTINTYFHVRFLDADSTGVTRPMKGALVRLMDRDSPPPIGDDFVLPASQLALQHGAPGGTGPTTTTTTRTRFERTSDEVVASTVTDQSGRIRIYLPHDQLGTQGGQKIVETTRKNLDTDAETTTVTKTPLAEAQPDFYFRVTRANGETIDTLGVPSGFFLNFHSARVGTRASPLVISFGGHSNQVHVDE